jgi:methyl-accepting chemotaxis protein
VRSEAGEGPQLHELAHQVRAEADAMTGSIEQLSAEANSISFNSMMQAGASASARDSLAENSGTLNRISPLAGETETRFRRVSELAAEGEDLARGAVTEMDRLSVAITRIEEQVGPLVEHAGSIGVAAELIRRIASQTKLLSLNATIEAVQAGDRGARFAIVAEGVRKLQPGVRGSARPVQRRGGGRPQGASDAER